MLKFIFLCFFIFFTQALSQAQLNDYVWYFGNHTLGLKFDFNTKVPIVLNGKYTPFSNEGCSVIANPQTGEVFYYADGIRVIDKNHNVMPNGNGLLGHSSSAQNGWSCPVPQECNKFYLFSNSSAYEASPSGTLYYSVIDMNLPGNGTSANPLGDIIPGSKNISVISSTSEAITIVNGPTKDYYWLLSPQYNSSNIRVLKVTSTGVSLSGTFNTGFTIRDIRNIRYSAESGKLCITGLHGLDPIVICDFDQSSGEISNPMLIPGSPFFNTNILYYGAYDSEWSPDGSKLYISFYRWYPFLSGRLYQYDLNQPASSPVLIYNIGGNEGRTGRGLKKGPDGKIYWIYHNNTHNSTRYLGVINEPDQAGLLCNFDPLGFDMGVDLSISHKFPDFLIYNNQKPNAQNDYLIGSDCINSAASVNILLNDSDPDNDDFTPSIISVKYGSAILNSDNSIYYTPSVGFTGNDTITYIISDDDCYPLSDTAIVVICVSSCDNNKPIASNDSLITCLNGGESQLIMPLQNDIDPDGDPLVINMVESGKGTVTVQSNGAITYEAPLLYNGIDSIAYVVCDSSCSILCDTAKLIFCINYEELFIPNLVTPNNDKKNDSFIIKGLYPNSLLQIYNRWGDLIFYSENYYNEWNGEGCSDGIYYYYFQDTVRKKNWKGWVHLIRKE